MRQYHLRKTRKGEAPEAMFLGNDERKDNDEAMTHRKKKRECEQVKGATYQW